MKKDNYVIKDGKKLKIGFTTGSCAAAAATAATKMALSGEEVLAVEISLPDSAYLDKTVFNINNIEIGPDMAVCSVTKDGGDDPDATHGMEIFAKVLLKPLEKEEEIVQIDGGIGIGRVTAKGLRVEVGKAAINPTPRKMIRENVEKVISSHNYIGGVSVEIFAPKGEEVAKKTFNSRLGIVGGISILGTTGIVDPMSEKALVDTIKTLCDKQKAIDPDNILISPGNFGIDFCRENLGLDITRAVEISNFVGEALDYIKYKGFKNILFVGHTGKLIKTAAGIMNTHSRYADGRMEIIGSHSAVNGADSETVKEILKCITTDQAFDLIKDKPYYQAVKEDILEKALFCLNYRLKNEVNIEVIMFTSDKNHIIQSKNARKLIEKFMEV